MKFPTLLFSLLVVLAAPTRAADESFHGALQRAGAAQPAQYSFSDLYRLATSGPGAALVIVPSGDAPVRTATALPPTQFSVSERAEPRLGLLLLAGLAAATWVARRRLGYAL